MLTCPTFSDLNPRRDDYASRLVQRLLQAAVEVGASDIHLEVAAAEVSLKWRVMGCLLPIASVPDGEQTKILGRVKALARLITYRHDIPQEGRMQLPNQAVEARVSTLPTLHGERAVIRLVASRTQNWQLSDLGLPPATHQQLSHGLRRASGVLLICGTPGAGKTTTAYACVREVLQAASQLRSIVSLEDPIEVEVPGVAQSQVNPAVGYDWTSGLKALLRQDPEVVLIGEIREADTAAAVFQAALAGQLVITTLHARSAVDALRRLMDMQVPAHHLRAALNVLVCQRLVPKRCTECQATYASASAQHDSQSEVQLSPPQLSPLQSVTGRCTTCGGSGTQGRLLLSECLPPIEGELARVLLQAADVTTLRAAAQAQGMRTLSTLAREYSEQGIIFASEIERHFIQ